jgi:hypothetical protein
MGRYEVPAPAAGVAVHEHTFPAGDLVASCAVSGGALCDKGRCRVLTCSMMNCTPARMCRMLGAE